MTWELSSVPNSLWYQVKIYISIDFIAAKPPDEICMHAQWSLRFGYLNSTDHLCNIVWGLCQSGRPRWRVDTQSFCRLSRCPDSSQQIFFFFPSSSFSGEGFPGCHSQCQHMLAADGWCSPSCTSVTHFSRAAEERPRRRERARMPWGRSRRRRMKRENQARDATDEGVGQRKRACSLEDDGCGVPPGVLVEWGQDGSTAVTAVRNAS